MTRPVITDPGTGYWIEPLRRDEPTSRAIDGDLLLVDDNGLEAS